MAKVTIIPQKISSIPELRFNETKKRRVAAYARVSTDSDEQYTSYEAQVGFYSNYIKERGDWEFVEVYADEGITGTNTKRRDNFNRMIKDALNGKIDLIITKSISRFARNTLDTLTFIRELKKHDVECYFEKENLWTLDPKSELVLTIMASIAQEESRSISQNVTWGKRVAFSEGRYSMPYKSFLGYKSGPDGRIEIDEEQAKVVKAIYTMYLKKGMTAGAIAEELKKNQIYTPSQTSCNWTKNSVNSILHNEKYKGDALLQKKYMVDFLEHKTKKNKGEITQYYVEQGHPAIIEPDMWEQVQLEMERRKVIGRKYSSTDVFAAKLICEDCGGFYGKKLWHSTDKYTKSIYQCNDKFKTKDKCKCETPTLSEEEIKNSFIKAYNQVIINKDQLIEDAILVKESLTNTDELQNTIVALKNEIEVLTEMVNKMIQENSSKAQSQTEYQKKYNDLYFKYEDTKTKLDEAIKIRSAKEAQARKINRFLENISTAEIVITEFDDDLFRLMIENVIVHKDKIIEFKFYNGSKVRVAS